MALSRDESKTCLNTVEESLRKLAVHSPGLAENAVRSFIQSMFNSTQSNIREFVSSVSGSELDTDGDLDCAKLEEHFLTQQKEMLWKPPSYAKINQSNLAGILLKRWLSR